MQIFELVLICFWVSEGNKVNSCGKIPGDEMSAISCILDVFLLDVPKTTKIFNILMLLVLLQGKVYWTP